MRGPGLTRAELAHYAPIDAEVAAFVAQNAGELLAEAEETYDPAGCYDDGYDEGSNAQLRELREKFSERIQETLSLMKPEPELGKKKRKLHALLCEILEEFGG